MLQRSRTSLRVAEQLHTSQNQLHTLSSSPSVTNPLLQCSPDVFLYCSTFLSDHDNACLAACSWTTLTRMRKYAIKSPVPLCLQGSAETSFFYHPAVLAHMSDAAFDAWDESMSPFFRSSELTKVSGEPTKFSFGVVSAIDISSEDCELEKILRVLPQLPRNVQSLYFEYGWASRIYLDRKRDRPFIIGGPRNYGGEMLTQGCFPDHVKKIIFRHDSFLTSSLNVYAMLLPSLSAWQLPASLTALQMPISYGQIDMEVELRYGLNAAILEPCNHGSVMLDSNDLSQVQFPSGLTSLSWFAYDTSDLSSLRLPDSLVSLRLGKFWDLPIEQLPQLPLGLQSLSTIYDSSQLHSLLKSRKVPNLLELVFLDDFAIDEYQRQESKKATRLHPQKQYLDYSKIEFPPKLSRCEIRSWRRSGVVSLHFSSSLTTLVLGVQLDWAIQFPPQLTTLYVSFVTNGMRFPTSLKRLYIGYMPEDMNLKRKDEYVPQRKLRYRDYDLNQSRNTVIYLPEGLECAHIRLGDRMVVDSQVRSELDSDTSMGAFPILRYPDEQFKCHNLLDIDDPWGFPKSLKELSLYCSHVAYKPEDIHSLTQQVLSDYLRDDLRMYYNLDAYYKEPPAVLRAIKSFRYQSYGYQSYVPDRSQLATRVGHGLLHDPNLRAWSTRAY